MGKPASSLSTFLRELKRRKVFRVAAVYAIAGWLIIQIAQTIFPILHLPSWTVTFMTVLIILGFPIAIIVAWAFELTPEGVKRTEDAEGELQEVERKTGLRLVYVIMVLVVIGMAYLFYEIKVKPPEAEITPVSAIRSIAVLPLDNLSGDPEQDYFSDGMTEALITELSQIGALRVISRTSVMQYKKAPKPLPQIAQELNVDAIVEGSVLRAGDRVRITAQLIKAEPEKHLWAQVFDRDLRDVLALHSEVARAIAREIKVTLTPQEDALLASKKIVIPKAHEAYLLGRHYYYKGLEPDLMKAIEYFEQALEIDSTYAIAYAGLADAYTWLGLANILPPEDTWPNARAAAEKALAIDEGLAEAHTSLAMVKFYYEWDWPGAEREFNRALEINPNSSDALIWYSQFLSAMERHDEAIAQIERALELDPRSFSVKYRRVFILYAAGQKNEAIRLAEDEIDSDPDQVHPYWYWALANFYADQGMYEKALTPLLTQMDLMKGDVNDELGFLGYLYGRLGRKAEALKQLDALDELAAKGRYVSPVNRSCVYIGLDDKDQAFEWLEKGYEMRAGWMPLLKVQFLYDNLRDDPRFTALLKKMKLDN